MKRFPALGLSVVVACALSALAATGAAARKAEHGALVVESHGGVAVLATESGAIKSASNEGTTEYTTATSGKTTTIFRGVQVEGFGLLCSSAGEPAGVVKTEPLSQETGWISKAKNEAGVDFKPASGEYIAQFSCEGLIVKSKGSVIGHATPLNVASLESSLNLTADTTPGKFRNSPSSFESGPEDIVRSTFSGLQVGNELETSQRQEGINVRNHGNPSVCKLKKGKEVCKPSAAVELSTIANPARPEYGRCNKKAAGEKYSDPNCTTPGPFKNGKNKGKYGFAPVPE